VLESRASLGASRKVEVSVGRAIGVLHPAELPSSGLKRLGFEQTVQGTSTGRRTSGTSDSPKGLRAKGVWSSQVVQDGALLRFGSARSR
jgi:hypothetical protein